MPVGFAIGLTAMLKPEDPTGTPSCCDGLVNGNIHFRELFRMKQVRAGRWFRRRSALASAEPNRQSSQEENCSGDRAGQHLHKARALNHANDQSLNSNFKSLPNLRLIVAADCFRQLFVKGWDE